jgi:hypothetical protein
VFLCFQDDVQLTRGIGCEVLLVVEAMHDAIKDFELLLQDGCSFVLNQCRITLTTCLRVE